MSVYLVGMSTLASLIKLILLLVVFVLILFASYYFTRWYAKSGLVKNQSKNIQIMESYPLGPGKQICIIRLGSRYAAVAISKEQITFLTELQEEDLNMEETVAQEMDFGAAFEKVLRSKLKKKDKND